MKRKILKGRHSIEIVECLSLNNRNTQCLLVSENNAKNILQSFYDNEIHVNNKVHVNMAFVIHSMWNVRNLARFLTYKHNCHLYLLSRKQDGYCSFVPMSNFTKSKYEEDFENIVAISLVYESKKEDIKGIKRKLKKLLND